MLCKKSMLVVNISWKHGGTRLKHALWNGVHIYVPGKVGILCPSAISVPWELEPRNLMVGRSRQWTLCCAFLVTFGQNVPGQMTSNLKKIAILDKMNDLQLFLENPLLWIISERKSQRWTHCFSTARGTEKQKQMRRVICRVFWRKFVGHWQAQQPDTLRERWWKFVREWYCSGLWSSWFGRFSTVL